LRGVADAGDAMGVILELAVVPSELLDSVSRVWCRAGRGREVSKEIEKCWAFVNVIARVSWLVMVKAEVGTKLC